MKKFFLLLTLMLFVFGLRAQVVTLNGYIKDMEGFYFFEKPFYNLKGEETKSINYNLLHNRLNFKIYPIDNLNLTFELRNRLYSGKLLEQLPGYADIIATDNGLIDLSWNIFNEDKWFLNSSIDRAFIDYTLGKFQIKVGRQRINWGINLVWNPNDIFNTFSYMDFDYEERPGSDAVLVTWYPTGSSSMDIAYKAAKSEENRAFALRYLFNLFNYDFQFVGGQAGYDYVLGGGWTGNVGSLSFRGEASYFLPKSDKKDLSEESFSGTVSLDYTFENSLFVIASFLYNSQGSTEKGESFSLINPAMELSAKKLSYGKYEVFGQVSYPIGTLVNTSLAAMLNPVDLSMYISPGITVSLHDNWEFYITSQIMIGEEKSEYAAMGKIYSMFGRLRWSF